MRRRNSTSNLTVDDLTLYLQGLFSSDLTLKTLLVSGEIAEFKRHTSGHCYFTLLGEESRISCALFKREAERLPEWPLNGDDVLVEGSVGLYPQRGIYQLYARRVIPLGAGAIDRARQELRGRLEAEGLFHPALKRPIPPYPSRVAVISSETGAALRDVLHIAARRYPLCEILVIPALVQGMEAPDSIVHALRRTAALEAVDCVLLVRGGGSREDLVPFDDERVIRAVRACPWPVVSGVGHEIDETLCDLAADLRASTPSAAAELVFPDGLVLLSQLRGVRQRLGQCMARRLSGLRQDCRASLARMRGAMDRRVADARTQMALRAASLDALSPLSTLARGFVTAEAGGRRLLSARGLKAGDGLAVHFQDGRADCLVQTVGREKFTRQSEKDRRRTKK